MRPLRPGAARGDMAIFKGSNKIHTTPSSLLGLTIFFSLQLKGVHGDPAHRMGTSNPGRTFQTVQRFFGQRLSIM